jgi:type II secretory pathway component PulK
MRSGTSHTRRCTDRRRRRGAISVIAMIGLLVAAMIGTSLVRLALARHRQVAHEALRLQAEWLAEAGVERAAARLAADADYDGETWNVAAENFRQGWTGRVTMTIHRGESAGAAAQVTVVAEYPAGADRRARTRKTVAVARR